MKSKRVYGGRLSQRHVVTLNHSRSHQVRWTARCVFRMRGCTALGGSWDIALVDAQHAAEELSVDRRTPFERARDTIVELRSGYLTAEQRFHVDMALAEIAVAMIGTPCTDEKFAGTGSGEKPMGACQGQSSADLSGSPDSDRSGECHSSEGGKHAK